MSSRRNIVFSNGQSPSGVVTVGNGAMGKNFQCLTCPYDATA